MKEPKDHLDIDLEFLDKKEPIRVAPSKPEQSKGNEPNWRYYDPNKAKNNFGSGKKYHWKNILIIGGIVLFIIWAIASSDDSSTNSTSGSSYTPSTQTLNYNSNDGTVIRGDYSCSSYAANRVDALAPTESEAMLTIAQNSLERRTNNLKNLKNEIDNSYVNEYSSQWEIDDYNQKVDEYNSLLPAFRRDAADLDLRIDKYNARVEARNNYLSQNCTPR